MAAELLDIGLYSVSQASQLTGVSGSSIRRWLWRQQIRTNGRLRVTSPLWAPQIATIDGSKTLGFQDLMEIRFVHALRNHLASSCQIRALHEHAATLFSTSHPFSSRRFRDEGRRLLAEFCPQGRRPAPGDALDAIWETLDYSDDGRVIRWWPLGRKRRVVIDPSRSFGHPILSAEGVSTEVLADACLTEGSARSVARWYDVSEAAVRDAVEFQHRLAA